MALALALLIVRGSGSPEGQSSFLRGWLTSYVEETAASATALTNDLSPHQLAEINSVFAAASPAKPTRTSATSLIQGNSLLARGSILTDILDQFADRGNDVVEYEVQDGDTISFIASDYGVSVATILNANHLKNADAIASGTKLRIPPVDGIIYQVKAGDTVGAIAAKFGVPAETIISFNALPQANDLTADRELIIPGGRTPSGTGPAQRAGNFSTGAAKRFTYLPDLGDFFAWPTSGYDWGRLHGRNGVDIANACGTPIAAAAAGTVTLAKGSGWNGGYGKYIKIAHPNGTETLYGHLSQLLTAVGDYAAKGQSIALMGSTGHSTGCHLHFEVHGAKNPLAKY